MIPLLLLVALFYAGLFLVHFFLFTFHLLHRFQKSTEKKVTFHFFLYFLHPTFYTAYSSPELFYSASKGIHHASRGIFGAIAGFLHPDAKSITTFLKSQDELDLNKIIDSVKEFDMNSVSFATIVVCSSTLYLTVLVRDLAELSLSLY